MIKKKIKLIFYNTMILLFLIIMIFSLTITKTNYYSLKDKQTYIIKINHEKISLDKFKQRYIIELINNNINLNNLKPSIKIVYKNKIYNKVISDIIYETLLKQYVQKLNISIQNSDVKNYIYNQKIFQNNKVFNIQKYHYFLNTLNISSQEYINTIKTELKINKFISSISNSMFILKNEIDNSINSLSQIRLIQVAPIQIPHTYPNLINTHKKIIKNQYKHDNFRSFTKQKNINYFLISKKIIYELNHGSKILFNKMHLKFQKPQLVSQFSRNKLSKLIFNLPHPKKNKNIYFSIIKNRNTVFLVKFYKIIHIRFSTQQKKIITSQLLKYNLEMVLNSIFKNLYTQANISYNDLFNLKNIFEY
ncbi:MAG: SurA N-terminal domain-containing protein [Buchnera aphidicola (Schlechtendalia peitan)]